MQCTVGKADELYSSKDYCPVSSDLYLRIAVTNIVLAAIVLPLCVALIVLEWLRSHSGTPLLRAVGLQGLGFLLLSSSAVVRILKPAVAPTNLFLTIGWACVLCGGYIFAFECMVLKAMRYASALHPEIAEAWEQRTRVMTRLANVINIFSCAVIDFDVVFETSSARQLLSNRICFSLLSLNLGLFSLVVGWAFVNVRSVQASLPEEAPGVFKDDLKRLGVQLPVLALVTFFGIALPNALLVASGRMMKMSGFILSIYLMLLHIVVAFLFIFELRVAWMERQQRRREASVVDDAEHDCDSEAIAQIIERGAMLLAVPRDQRWVSHFPPVWERGVSIRFLELYIEEHSIGDDVMTADVVEEHVKPSTKPGRCSVWEAILAAEAPSESELVGTPRFMVSHAWSYKLKTLASIIRHHVGHEHSSDSVYFFLDFFCMNQHDLSDVMGRNSAAVPVGSALCLQDALIDCLTRSITYGGLMLMALDSWKKPTTLSRCWCLYELYIAYNSNIKVVMALSPHAQANFVEALRSAPSSLLEEAVSEVNVQQAKATVSADRDMILEMIRHVGFDIFDAFIRSKVVSSLRVAALSAAVGDKRRLTFRQSRMNSTRLSSMSNSQELDESFKATSEHRGMGTQLLTDEGCFGIELAVLDESAAAPTH